MWKFASKFAAKPSEENIYALLSTIADPNGQGDIVSNNRVSNITIDNKNIICILEIDPTKAADFENIRLNTESKLREIKGVDAAQVILTAEKSTAKEQDTPQPQSGLKPPPQMQGTKPPPAPPLARPDVKHMIAISSGKGGVGKSTVSFNIAIALKDLGFKVGLLDADIYGPSQPRLSGLTGIDFSNTKPDTNENGKIIPPQAHGLSIMSMGFLVGEESPLIWRGPMVQSAIVQLFRDVDWDGLDYLIIDMPPGTGDAQLTLAQKMPPDSAIIVSTPQDLALIDARKGLEMYKKTNISISGIIENMSVFTCPKCGENTPIFGHDGAKQQAAAIGIPFLGAIPLDITIRQSADKGQPSVNQAFIDIAKLISQP
jgi:ATP-binding protein involved in chromosome partitioning